MRLETGDLFGELALLTGRPQQITVVAASELDVMVLTETAFREQLRASLERAMSLLESLGSRLMDALVARPRWSSPVRIRGVELTIDG